MRKSGIIIRQATAKDIPEVDTLWEEAARYHGTLDSRLAMRLDDTQAITTFHEKQLKSDKVLFLVGVVKDKVVGYSIAHIRTNQPPHTPTRIGIVDGMAVTSTFRGQGIGTQLYEKTLKWFEAYQVERIDTSVAALNPRAQSFWTRKGFTPRIYQISHELTGKKS